MNIQAVWTDELTEQLPKETFEKITQFMDLLDLLNDKKIVINLDEDCVYECEDFAEWLYSRKEPELADIKKELLIKMSKCHHCGGMQIKQLTKEIGKVQLQKCFALNEYRTNFLLQNENNKSYRDIAAEFQRDTGIECSPQGDKKALDVLKREFKNKCTGHNENINCELHTKFNRFNKDKEKQDRIYFAPAKKGICSGRVIVIHIGGHL